MIQKDQQINNFTILSSDILRDESLSMGARMFYALAQSFSDEWNINIKHFAKLLNVSEASVRKYRNELVSAGLLQYSQIRDEKGKLTQESVYTFNKLEIIQSQCVDSIDSQEQEAQNSISVESYPFKHLSAYGDSADISNNNKSSNINSNKVQKPTALFLTITQSFKSFKDTKLSPKSTKFKESLPLESYTKQEIQAYKDFIAYRKEKGFLAKSTINSIIKDFEKLKMQNADIVLCVETCINRGWSGLLKAHEALLRYESFKKPQAKNYVGKNQEAKTAHNPLERLGQEVK